MSLECKTCKHWHQTGKNALDLSAPAHGDCRLYPPAVHVVGRPSQQGTPTMALYAALPANFPACSQHETRLETAAT